MCASNWESPHFRSSNPNIATRQASSMETLATCLGNLMLLCVPRPCSASTVGQWISPWFVHQGKLEGPTALRRGVRGEGWHVRCWKLGEGYSFLQANKVYFGAFFWGLLVNMIYIYTYLLIPKTYAILAKAVNLLIPIRSSRPFIAQSFIE